MYAIKDVTPLLDFKLIVVVFDLDNINDVKVLLTDLSSVVEEKYIQNKIGGELKNQEVFNDIIVDSCCIEWNRTDGFSIGLDSVFNRSVVLFEMNKENTY